MFSAIIMSWFSDTIINKTEVSLSTTEARIIAGTIVFIASVLALFLCLRAHSKFAKAKMRQTAQREIRLNNVNSQQ